MSIIDILEEKMKDEDWYPETDEEAKALFNKHNELLAERERNCTPGLEEWAELTDRIMDFNAVWENAREAGKYMEGTLEDFTSVLYKLYGNDPLEHISTRVDGNKITFEDEMYIEDAKEKEARYRRKEIARFESPYNIKE
jgi:hypothetical protein